MQIKINFCPVTGARRTIARVDYTSRPAVCTPATTQERAALSSSLTIQVGDQRDYRAAVQLCAHTPQPGDALHSPPHWLSRYATIETIEQRPSCVHTRHNPGARCALLLTDYPGTRPERLETIEQPPSCVHTRHNPGARCTLLLTDYPGTRPERL